jgi:hypothetical protein
MNTLKLKSIWLLSSKAFNSMPYNTWIIASPWLSTYIRISYSFINASFGNNFYWISTIKILLQWLERFTNWFIPYHIVSLILNMAGDKKYNFSSCCMHKYYTKSLHHLQTNQLFSNMLTKYALYRDWRFGIDLFFGKLIVKIINCIQEMPKLEHSVCKSPFFV